jgi:hypothetical protein
VEPLVRFWESLEDMCLVIAQAIEKTPMQTDDFKKNQVEFFLPLSRHGVIDDISVKELNQQHLDDREALFLKCVTEDIDRMYGRSSVSSI